MLTKPVCFVEVDPALSGDDDDDSWWQVAGLERGSSTKPYEWPKRHLNHLQRGKHLSTRTDE